MTDEIRKQSFRAVLWLLATVYLPFTPLAVDLHGWYWASLFAIGSGICAGRAVYSIIVAAAYYTGRGVIDAAVLQKLQKEMRERGLEP